MSTFNEQLKEIERFFLECAAELRCQIKENKQQRVDSLQGNVDQRVETERKSDALRARNLASQGQNPAQSHTEINSNLGASLEKQDPETSESSTNQPNRESRSMVDQLKNPTVNSGVQSIPGNQSQAQEQSDNGGSTYMGGNLSNQILNPTPRETNLEVDSFHENRMSEQEFLGTLPKEIHWGHNNSSYSMKQITSSSTPTTSKLGVCLNLESELGRADREMLSPSTEKMISEFKEGNSKYSEFDLIDVDGIELSSCVIECEKWDYHGLDDNLGVRDLQLQPTIVKDSVGFKEFKFMVNAHKMFDEMPTRGVLVLDALFDEEIPMSKYIEFIPLTLPYDRGKLNHGMVAGIAEFDLGIDDRHECISWDFAIFVLVYIEGETATDHRNWVFDPGGVLAHVVLRVVCR